MVSTAGRIRGSSWWFACLVLVATIGANKGYAQVNDAAGQTGALRPADPKASALLQAGAARSATFRLLTEAIERSDLIVWIEAGNVPHRGQLQFVAATPYSRYVRVAVRLPGLENDLISTLAHELQHAVEIAGAPEVRNHKDLLRLYQRIGRGGRVGGTVEMETAGAQKTGTTVLNELLDARRRAER